jgi:MFS transporter, ACS family, D-galactonate transporter
MSAPAPKPTWVRWRIVLLLMALSALSWFLRRTMPVAFDERIEKQLGISAEAIGWVYSAFLIVYMLLMTPGGWFIDRFGPRRALLLMGGGLMVFGALTGLVGPAVTQWGGTPVAAAGLALVLFLVIRSLMGGFAAPMYPAGTEMVSRWLPFRRRGTANGLVQGSACVGIAAAAPVFGALIDWVDWPQAFLIAAVVTGLVTLTWALYARDRPEQHPSVNPAERQLIREDGPAAEDGAKESSASWTALLRNRSLVLLTVSYAAVGYFEYLFVFWMDYYFKDTLHLPDDRRRWYSCVMFLAMGVGMGLGGWLSDRFVQAFGPRRGRAIVPVAGMLGGAVLLGLGLLATDPEWIVVLFALALTAVGSVEGPFWTTAQELGGRYGGTSAGIVNTGGNGGGMIAPIVTPWVGRAAHWSVAVALGGAVCLAGVVLWLWIDPRERVGAG